MRASVALAARSAACSTASAPWPSPSSSSSLACPYAVASTAVAEILREGLAAARPLAAGQCPDAAQEGVGQRQLGRLDFGVSGLVEPGLVQHLEQRPVLGGEADVPTGHGGQPVRGLADLPGSPHELGIAQLVAVHGDGGEQVVPVGEVRVRGADRHAEPPARLGQGEATDAAFADELDRGIDQCRPQVTVVIPAALAWSRHGPQGRARRARSANRKRPAALAPFPDGRDVEGHPGELL